MSFWRDTTEYSDSKSENAAETNIMAKWKQEDMRKHQDAILNQQGGVHY